MSQVKSRRLKLSTNHLVLVPHNLGSGSARRLADSLTNKVGHKVWRVTEARVRNRIPFYLRQGTDKLTQLTQFKNANINCPEFTTDHNIATGWINAGSIVVCRTLLRSCEGRGIVVAESVDQIVAAPLYTKYVKKKKEFRVHVLNNQVIDVQEKRKRKGFENERDTRIRNTANGYVFCRENLVEPDGLREIGIRAVTSLGYNLGAVDIAYNEHHNQLVVLEVNANPGLEGTTLEKYSSKIKDWYQEKVRT
jgi:glutathione synthase/RimK-type ligase-like ATP-grasp enzyme